MAQSSVAHFQNDQGVETIEIGVKTFMCCGASEPYDHPHVFLDMGSENEIVCPYCSTKYVYASDLSGNQSRPDGCTFVKRSLVIDTVA